MSKRGNELVARLTESAQTATASMTADEVEAVRRYQARDRTYELVAAVLRDPKSSDDLSEEQADLVDTIVRILSAATRRWRVPVPVAVYRGQRSLGRVFGAGPRVGRTIQPATFLSTSISRDVALEEFAAPPGPGGPALFEVAVPAGTQGLWLPPIGDPELAYQGELLLPRRTRLLVRGERDEAGILVLDCEVLP